MLGIINFDEFIFYCLIISIVPGLDTIYILGNSLTKGKKAGYFSTLGIISGATIHCILVTFGISILITKNVVYFDTLKYLGAVYLIFMGIETLLSKNIKFIPNKKNKKKPFKLKKIYFRGIATNFFNPKIILFFITFLPQFVSIHSSNYKISLSILCLIMISSLACWFFILVTFSSFIFTYISKHPYFPIWINRITGMMILFIGINFLFVTNT